MKTLLIANRGEIACRIMRTARALGIRTVAVYSETDANAQHVVQADVAIALAGETAAETYLDIDQIVSAAITSGADAYSSRVWVSVRECGLCRSVRAGKRHLCWATRKRDRGYGIESGSQGSDAVGRCAASARRVRHHGRYRSAARGCIIHGLSRAA